MICQIHFDSSDCVFHFAAALNCTTSFLYCYTYHCNFFSIYRLEKEETMILLCFLKTLFLTTQLCFPFGGEAKVDITRLKGVTLQKVSLEKLREELPQHSKITLVRAEVSRVELPNQVCEPRKALVNVEITEMPHYTPMMVEVNRCGGVADNVNPLLKDCVKNHHEKLRFPVRSKFDPNFVVYKEVENHLSCKGKCKHDASVCHGASKWDPERCRCLCAMNQACPPHFSWDPNKCACVCTRTCHRRQIVDYDDCSCTCRAKFFKRCAKRGKNPDPIHCMCRQAPVAAASCRPCRCRKSISESVFYRYLLSKNKSVD